MICTAAIEDHVAGARPMEKREEIPSGPWRSAIATLTVETDSRVPSAHGGAGRAKQKAITCAGVMSRRNGMAGPPA
jgi:hypothetical protein